MRARRLSSSFIYFLGLPACLFLSILITWIAYHFFQRSTENAKNSAAITAQMVSTILERSFNRAAFVARSHATLVQSGVLSSETQITQFLEASIRSYPTVYGGAIAFAPNTFFPDRGYYSPYAYWKTESDIEIKDLGAESYRAGEQAWFTIPKATLTPTWSEPYDDQGGGDTWMTTISVPFFRPGSEKTAENFWGIATSDLSFAILNDSMKKLPIPGSGYGFLISKDGNVVRFDGDQVRFIDAALESSPAFQSILRRPSPGLISAEDPFKGGAAWIAFQPLQQGAFYFAVVYPQAEWLAEARRLKKALIAIGMVATLALFAAIFFISRSVTRPIGTLASAAHQIANGDFNKQIVSGSNVLEVQALSSSFQKMMNDLQSRIHDLQTATAAEAKIRGELNAAHRIQMSMLPPTWSDLRASNQHIPTPIEEAIHLHASIQSAREVGGDFYNYEFIDEHHLGLMIADVSGKGIPAAMFMAMTSTFFKSFARISLSPALIVEKVNRALCAENQTGMFVTLMYGVVDLRSGKVEICNAGHIPPIFIDTDGSCADVNTPKNPALGLIPNHQFSSGVFTLIPGSRWIAYTDGVTEAISPEKKLLGIARFKSILAEYRGKSLDEMCESIITDVRKFTGGGELSDDLTLLAIEYTPENSLPEIVG